MLARGSLRVASLAMLLLGLCALSPRAVVGDTQSRGATPAASAIVMIDHNGHRRVLRDFFGRRPSPSVPGRKGSLPPGLVAQLRAQGHLPPALEAWLTPIPLDLGSRLPAVPPYFSRYFAGRDLIIVDTRTNRIVSVIGDIRP